MAVAGIPGQLALSPALRAAQDGPAGEAAIEAVAKEFESLLLGQLLKSMRRTVPKDGFLGSSFGKETYTSMLDTEIAGSVARSGGIGLHRMLIEQLGGRVSESGLSSPLRRELQPTSSFGMRRHPIHHTRRMHAGIDLAAAHGEPVRAAAGGTVLRAERAGGYGLLVEVEHPGGLTTRYAHLSRVDVREGDVLTRGHIVGRAGATGAATGPHLHFEVRVDGDPRDPIDFLTNRGDFAKVEQPAADVRVVKEMGTMKVAHEAGEGSKS